MDQQDGIFGEVPMLPWKGRHDGGPCRHDHCLSDEIYFLLSLTKKPQLQGDPPRGVGVASLRGQLEHKRSATLGNPFDLSEEIPHGLVVDRPVNPDIRLEQKTSAPGACAGSGVARSCRSVQAGRAH
jgi:hypothetical protein